jgi:hypothetical protein
MSNLNLKTKNMLTIIRKSRWSKGMSLLLSFLIVQPYFANIEIHAHAGGPTQPEFSGYTAVGNSDFVDPFTGNVGYNIPLFEIGGYPINLTYSGDINPQQDAGWVGLGWSLNLGSVNRSLRGVPDDFDGDEVYIERNSRPSISADIVFNNLKSEAFGLQANTNKSLTKYFNGKSTNYKFSLSWDNNTGLGIGLGADWELSKNEKSKDDVFDFRNDSSSFFSTLVGNAQKSGLLDYNKYPDSSYKQKYAFQMSLDYNSKSRTSVSSGFSKGFDKFNLTENMNLSFNSRSSQADLGMYTGYSRRNWNSGYSNNFSREFVMQVPPPETRTRTYTLNLDFSKGNPVNQKRKYSGIISVTEEHLVNKAVSKKAFGYFHLKDRHYDNGSIMDYEEFPNSISRKMDKYSRTLTPASKTYDVFNISAAGIGGSFRAHHNSVFMLSPSTVESKPYVNNFNLKGEFGKNELGVDIGIGVKKEKYGAIPEDNNKIVENLKYKGEAVNDLYEPITFRNEYEFIENDLTFYNAFGSTDAIYPKISTLMGQFNGKFYNKSDAFKFEANSQIVKPNRDARQQVIACRTAKEASTFSLVKEIENYWWDENGVPVLESNNKPKKSTISRNSEHRKDHHLSEIMITQPDGSRYFFSTPVYNLNTVDVSFDASDISNSNINYINGTVSYETSDLKKTEKGNSARFYESKKTPAYASTFLLNAIISPDYVDVEGDGPSESDIGNYVKINYSLYRKTYGKDQDSNYLYNNQFKWRSPIEEGTANISSGFKSDKYDNRAYYSYGEKELWYAHSIETKDQIAFFYLKPRLDGWEVKDEFGGLNRFGKTQLYLQQIVIFSKNEFYQSGFSAVPLKTVFLDYSYDLCKNFNGFGKHFDLPHDLNHPLGGLDIYGNPEKKDRYKGKLTLHKVWFTYGTLGVRTSAPYVLEYNTLNPDYKNRSMDRWGTYMPEDLYQNGGAVNDVYTTSNSDHPFLTQDDKTSVDDWASAWMLSDITLPSGGKIHFDYESDDYAYVQDRKAMRMVNIYGMNNEGKVAGCEPDLYVKQRGENKNYYLLFEKPSGHASSNYFKEGDLVYYDFNVKLNPKNSNSKEQVSGYFEVEEIGLASDNSNYVYIKVKPERAGLFNAHPVTRMALQYGLSNVPHNIYPGSDLRRSEFKPLAIADMMFGAIPDALGMLMGKYNYFETMGYCQKLDVSKSYIRIPELDGIKLGGGHRVKRVTLSDQWNEMTGTVEQSSNYSIDYIYKTNNEENEEISSGVASYEPNVGSCENPWKMPINEAALKKMSSKRFKQGISYDVGPIGEEFFSSPSVGYSKVKIKNVYPSENIERHKTGYTVKEFYTAKDYPSFSEITPVQMKKSKFGTPNLGGGFASKGYDDVRKNEDENKSSYIKFNLDISASYSYTTASQGIMVETNDMHGKSKAEWVYSEDGIEPLSGQRIFYKEREKGKLSNEITVLRPDQSIEKTTAGLSIEPTIYGSETVENNHSIRPNFNIDRVGPTVLFNILPGYSLHKQKTKLITTTKHVTRTGIIDSVVVYDKGASTSTKNLAWDALTGQVLLSSVNNEYNDAVYSLVKPAHWMYEGMAGAYQNQNLLVELNLTSGIATDPTNAMFKGDELIISNLETEFIYHVLDRSGSQVSLVNVDGSQVSDGTFQFRVVRSGHRNILGNSAEVISLLKNPLNLTSNTFEIDPDWVVDAKAFVYDDIRRVLPADKYCFQYGCSAPSSYELAIDTTSFGHYINYTLKQFPSTPHDTLWTAFYFGRPTFNNCCDIESGEPDPTCLNVCGSTGEVLDNVVNPYVLGIRGIWNINGQYVYFEKRNNYAQRTQDLDNSPDLNSTTMRYDGRLQDYKEFWTYSGGVWSANTTQSISNPWTWKESMTQIDQHGNPVQSVNALSISSAQLFGYNDRRLLTAQSANAKVRNILFDGFEDISTNTYFMWGCDSAENFIKSPPIISENWDLEFCSKYRHWPVSNLLLGGGNSVTDKVSHTGKKSIQLGRGESVVALNDLISGSATPNATLMSNYHLQSEDFIERFFPESEKEYLISLWVKETYRDQFVLELRDQSNASITLNSFASNGTIDGWRQLNYKFTLSSGQSLGQIKFINKAPIKNNLQYCFIDDIRIAPLQSGMNCYVYDENNYRILATLDNNNYATFYEYDEEGALVRKKVETEKGIMTLTEQRLNNRR